MQPQSADSPATCRVLNLKPTLVIFNSQVHKVNIRTTKMKEIENHKKLNFFDEVLLKIFNACENLGPNIRGGPNVLLH